MFRSFEIAPEDFGVQRDSLAGLGDGGAEENAATIRNVLGGRRRDGARTLVLLNAAAALHVGGTAADLEEGMFWAEDSIDSGSAIGKLDEFLSLYVCQPLHTGNPIASLDDCPDITDI